MDISSLRPLRDVVVVLGDAIETETASGIVTTVKTEKAKATTGTVVAAGPDANLVVNDRVAFTTNIIKTDTIEKNTYYWMTTENILGTYTA